MAVEINNEPIDFSNLDSMTRDQAISHLETLLEATISYVNRYQKMMLAHDYGTKEFNDYKHVWQIDLSNIIKIKKVLDEVRNEE